MSVAGPRGPELAGALAAAGFSGVALVQGPDGMVAEVAAGTADRVTGRAIAPGSRFGTASASKLFTAVALVSCFERGLASPATFVADLLRPDLRPRAMDPGVTLEHLLTHTSGIADYFDEYGDEPFEAIWRRTNPALVRAPRDLLPLFGGLPARALPGAEVRYCNAGFILAGLAIETLTGRSFYEAVAEAVLEPAGMTATGYPALDEAIPDVAIGYLDSPGTGDTAPNNLFAIPARGQPDGGAFTTASDVVRFLDAFRDGRLVGPAWRDEMLRPRVADQRESTTYGLAWWIAGEGLLARVGHPGGDPGYDVRVRWYPATGHRVVVLSNVSGGAGAAMRRVEDLLLATPADGAGSRVF